jgi:hypothetical protein
MKKYLLKAEWKLKLLLCTGLALSIAGVVLSATGFAVTMPYLVVIGAGLIFGACIEFLYIFNYKYDFCIDYEKRKIFGTKQQEKGTAVMEIYFESVVSAEIMEKEALAAEFGFKKSPSYALVLRGVEKDTVIPLTWFSKEQMKEMLKEVRKIAGAYLC